MDIFKFAKERELKMEGLYKELSSETNNVGLKKILNMLAEQEAMHYRVIESMEKKNSVNESESSLIKDSVDILKSIKERKDTMDLNISQPDMYVKVKEFEKESEEFYTKLANEENDQERKKIFELFAKEERKHFDLMNELVEFVSKPESWVEHAEFSSLRDY